MKSHRVEYRTWLTWDGTQLNPAYQGTAGICYDSTYTYVGIPVATLVSPVRGTLILLQ